MTDGARHRTVHHMTPAKLKTAAARLLSGAMLLMVAFSAGALSAEELRPEPVEQEVVLEGALPEDIDWDALAAPLDVPYTPAPRLRGKPAPNAAGPGPAWSRTDRPDGTAALSLKQPVTPFWDMRAGVDLDVTTPASPLRTPHTLPDKLAADRRAENSQGAAWLTARAPGVPYLSDHVALEARMNPSHDARFGTVFSKSLPLWGDHISVVLRHGYYVTQYDPIPGLPGGASHGRSFEMDRSAQFSIADTGTSFLAGQSLAPSGDRWLNSIGAQQKLFGGLSITGSVSETAEGFSNTSFTAGFKRSW